MPRFDPYNLQLQITRMFAEGQDLFAVNKVQDWLRYLQQDPNEFEIRFRKRASPDRQPPFTIEIVLQRKDGQPVDQFLVAMLNQQGPT
jgi:PAS domain-containing protein